MNIYPIRCRLGFHRYGEWFRLWRSTMDGRFCERCDRGSQYRHGSRLPRVA